VSSSVLTDAQRRRRRGGPWRGPLPYLGGLLVLYLLVPVVVLLVHLGSGAGSGLSAGGLGSALWISLLTASISAAIIALFGIPLAWMLARGSGRAWDAIGVAVQLPLALPPLMSGILLIDVVGPYTPVGRLFAGRLTDTAAGIVLAQTFVAAPFLIVAARSAFAAVDPELLDVAATLGHGSWSRFARVSLPLAAPGIEAGLLLSWLRAFGEFGATMILAYHPYSLPVFTFVQFSSTGVPSTLAPTGAAIAAAAVVLVLARLAPGRWAWTQWNRQVAGRSADDRCAVQELLAWEGVGEQVPAVDGEPAAVARDEAPVTLSFELHARLGSFELELEHAGRAAALALLGPSGAGKSFTLRCLAGLRGLDVGKVALGSRDLSGVSTEERRIGWVPQDAALFPHLSVWRQLTFGVDTDPTLAARWLHRLGLAELADRLPHQLSGGQRQRVALARALASDPDLILLDEPFSSLDRPVREELRRELARLQRTMGVPTVLVTHDPEEAAMLADEVVVLADGAALQAGSRAEVFERPASPRVAELLAIDNVREGEILDADRLASHGTVLAVPDTGLASGTWVTWCVRSEHVLVYPESCSERGWVDDPGPFCADDFDEGMSRPAVVLDVFDLGAWREVTLRLDGGLELTARTVKGRELVAGLRRQVVVASGAIQVWADVAAVRRAEAVAG
jgi:molybdate transport system permease protein